MICCIFPESPEFKRLEEDVAKLSAENEELKTKNGEIVAMPLSQELEDSFILLNNKHTEDSYVEQICDACDFLIDEAEEQGGRILS